MSVFSSDRSNATILNCLQVKFSTILEKPILLFQVTTSRKSEKIDVTNLILVLPVKYVSNV